jgi:hypothetical protein
VNGLFAAASFDRFPKRGGDSRRFGLVSQPSKKISDLLFLHPTQQNARRLPPLGIHPEVQRNVVFPRKASARVVDLHRGDAEVGEYHVRAVSEAFRFEELAEPRVVAPHTAHGPRVAERLRERL